MLGNHSVRGTDSVTRFFTPILYQFFIVQGACLTGTPLKVSVYIVNQTNKCQNLVTIWNFLGGNNLKTVSLQGLF